MFVGEQAQSQASAIVVRGWLGVVHETNARVTDEQP